MRIINKEAMIEYEYGKEINRLRFVFLLLMARESLTQINLLLKVSRIVFVS